MLPNLLKLSRLIDRLNAGIGRSVAWLVLAAVLISSGNAVARKLFNSSSNAFLEVQWYLFSAVFLLAAAHTLLRQEHVRIDVLLARWSARTRAWVDVFGIVFFLLPLVVVVVGLSWPLLVRTYVSGEMSSNAGGLIRWPVLALLPLAFALLGVQGISELIKRLAWLNGLLPEPAANADVGPGQTPGSASGSGQH